MVTRIVNIPFAGNERPAPAPQEENVPFKQAWSEKILITTTGDGTTHIFRKNTVQMDESGFLRAQTIFEDTILLSPEIEFFVERIVVGIPLVAVNPENGEYTAMIRWMLAPVGTLDISIEKEDDNGLTLEVKQHNCEGFEMLAEDVLFTNAKPKAVPRKRKRNRTAKPAMQQTEEH